MDPWIAILLPLALVMSRVAAFLAVCPVFSAASVPVVIRAGLMLLLTLFFGLFVPAAPLTGNWLSAVVLMLREAAVGLALGLAARLVYTGVQQGGQIVAQQMGMTDSDVIDPVSGSGAYPISTLLEMLFALLFLMSGGHRLLLGVISGSFRSLPVAGAVDLGAMAEGVVEAGSMMFLMGLKLAAPMLAGFLIVAVMLCILARVLPEMNILMTSFPLRVAMGLFLAGAIMPSLQIFMNELARWIQRSLIT